MNRILLAALALVATGPVCLGQTNSPAGAASALPRPALESPAEPKPLLPAGPAQANTNSPAGQLSIERHSADAAVLNRIEQEGLLQQVGSSRPGESPSASSRVEGQSLLQPRGPIYDSDLERAAAFKPEVTRVGRAHFYSSITTAIARKNPLCLLDPTLLDLSW